MSLLEVEDLQVTFDGADGRVEVVHGVSFSLNEGESLGIVGESGCGKSQTVLALLGLLDSNGRAQGRARFRGQELIGQPARALNRIRGAKIATIFQDPMTALNPHLRIETQLVEVLRQHAGLRVQTARERALEMLTSVRLPDPSRCMRGYPHELSGGQRQRVMIAMSLLCEPEILIADEPTTAVDATVQAEILQFLRELIQSSRMALILITHDLGVVAGTCERVLVMYAGRVIESGPTGPLFYRPQHPYTQALLTCASNLEAPAGESLLAIPGRPPQAGEHPAGCSFAPRCRHAFAPCARELPPLVPFDRDRASACHLGRRP